MCALPISRFRDGQRARLLDAYGYGTWWLGDESSINLRLGQQLVAWGESLFLSGVASAQSQADATKAFIPGTEIKDILLPTNQIAFNAAVNNDITLLGRSEEHTSELQSLMRTSYAVLCLKKNKTKLHNNNHHD